MPKFVEEQYQQYVKDMENFLDDPKDTENEES